ncbi:uncharacterized protein LOC106669299 [Cimex lectularius]|uniref:Uncharacterized protein n=1 Tax=Cimex lectularius TaxID=79782 RepID=A0A8I6RZI8_CIMLE|nr:uncharacterized protein LOC106669299 [Cimex lectularius]XP_014254158.1 uncharacterized protein LOC106669299 [Cimex lectularius]XP_014254159.1 uncharacterized protein LOC106669299 [Cimex lectularius]
MGKAEVRVALLWVFLVWGTWAVLHLFIIGILFYVHSVPLIEAVKEQVEAKAQEEEETGNSTDIVRNYLERIGEEYLSSAYRSFGAGVIAFIQIVLCIMGILSSRKEQKRTFAKPQDDDLE